MARKFADENFSCTVLSYLDVAESNMNIYIYVRLLSRSIALLESILSIRKSLSLYNNNKRHLLLETLIKWLYVRVRKLKCVNHDNTLFGTFRRISRAKLPTRSREIARCSVERREHSLRLTRSSQFCRFYCPCFLVLTNRRFSITTWIVFLLYSIFFHLRSPTRLLPIRTLLCELSYMRGG